MTSFGRPSATPFLVSVAPRVCDCKLAGKELGKFKRAEKAIREIGGYWNVYVGFFGDQTMWLDFTVTDVRDGKVIWKNGRQLTEEDYGTTNESDAGSGRANGKRPPGEWIIGGRGPGW